MRADNTSIADDWSKGKKAMSSRLMRAGMLPKRPIRKGEKERKKRKIEVGQGKPLKLKKHEFCKRWLFVELMFENHRVPALIGL